MGSIKIRTIIVNIIIQSPIFSMPKRPRNLKIPSITYPRSHAICPIMGVVDWVNNILILLNQGTGSYPPLEKGLQRRILQAARIPPRNAPYFSIASMAYCEQVGIYLQVDPPFIGDRYF
jgi:hypothetical protein